VDGDLPAAWLIAPLVGRALTEIAHLEHAGAVAHGALGWDAVRIERAVRDLDPSLSVVPSVRAEFVGRAALESYLDRGAPRREEVLSSAARSPSGDAGFVGAALQDAGQLPPADAFVRIRLADTSPTESVLELRFERGWPVAVNGAPMPLVDLLDSAGTIAARTAWAAPT
jgi:argininosuccinate synthase